MAVKAIFALSLRKIWSTVNGIQSTGLYQVVTRYTTQRPYSVQNLSLKIPWLHGTVISVVLGGDGEVFGWCVSTLAKYDRDSNIQRYYGALNKGRWNLQNLTNSSTYQDSHISKSRLYGVHYVKIRQKRSRSLRMVRKCSRESPSVSEISISFQPQFFSFGMYQVCGDGLARCVIDLKHSKNQIYAYLEIQLWCLTIWGGM